MSGPDAGDRELHAFVESVGSDGPVAVEGNRTAWTSGGSLEEGTRLVQAPTGVVVLEPAEMTVRVRAGTPVRALQDELGAVGQRTALPDRGGTVGGALAVGADDVRALALGRVRASVLQIRYVSAEGRLITGGGPTVKNVSGFDLPRLLAGSLGTLGAIAEVTLRSNPLPSVSRWLVAQDIDPQLAFDSCFRPAAALFDGISVWILLEGHRPDVDAQQVQLGRLAAFEEVAGGPVLPPNRWSLPPADLPSLTAESVGKGFVASLGTGTVFSHQRRPEAPVAAAVRGLHTRIKAEFDPTGRLNPGRDPLSV